MRARRFKTEKQILDAIDRNRQNGERALARASDYERQAKLLFKQSWESKEAGLTNYEFLRREGNKLLEKSDASRKYATMILGPRARKLGERLAEFRTAGLLSLVGTRGIGDMSVEGI